MKRTGQPAETTDSEKESLPADGERLLCRQCLSVITRQSEQVEVGGFFRHTFANPHGIVFEIGCFRSAVGCGYTGLPTNEFTWFGGYYWQVAVCAACLTHMGWRFTATDKFSFFGLILDRLLASRAGTPF